MVDASANEHGENARDRDDDDETAAGKQTNERGVPSGGQVAEPAPIVMNISW
jgi:hypothetical protein